MRVIVDDVFTGILTLLIEQGYVTLDTYVVDGTKMEANANRYTLRLEEKRPRESYQVNGGHSGITKSNPSALQSADDRGIPV